MPITCGTLGCLGLLIIVGGGFYAARNLPRLLNYYFSTVEREIDRTATAEVTAEQKAALRKELQRFRANLEKGETPSDAQSIVLDLNRAIRDQRLTPEEVENLTRRLRDANDRLENKVAKPEARSQKPENRAGSFLVSGFWLPAYEFQTRLPI